MTLQVWLGKATLSAGHAEKLARACPNMQRWSRNRLPLSGQINGRYGDPAWTPIRYVNRSYSRATLAGSTVRRMSVRHRAAARRNDLVAKEYVAAQDPDDPGVLVLSQFAGAAQELDAAGRWWSILMRPRAWPPRSRPRSKCRFEERKERFQQMYEHLAANDIDRWAERFLSALGETREQPGLLGSLRQLFAARA